MNHNSTPVISMPESASWIVNKLTDRGYQVCLFGACVRDSFLGITPDAWNIATSASPEEVRSLFGKTGDAGCGYGTITVWISGESYEVSSFRTEDGLKELLKKQAFTADALAWNDREGLIDPFGGRRDLQEKTISCIGNPGDLFKEHPIYMLQAIRLSGQLNFSIDPGTREAISENYQQLSKVSMDLIRTELMKLLTSSHPDRIRDAFSLKLTSVFLPEFDTMMVTPQDNPHHCYSVGEHTIHALMAAPAIPALRLAVLLHDIGKPATRSTDPAGIDHFYGHNERGAELADSILKRLAFDDPTRDTVIALIANHDVRFRDSLTTGRSHVRKMCAKVGADLFPWLLDVMEADVSAQSDYMRMKKLLILKETRQAYQEILAAGDCLTLEDLAISGNDLHSLGIRDSRVIEALLRTLLNLVLDHPECNRKEYLTELAGKIYLELENDRK